MTSNYILCGKLDNRVDMGPFLPFVEEKLKLYETRTVLDRHTVTLPVSVGEQGVWFNGQLWEFDKFLLMAAAKKIKRLQVLTNREYLQCVERFATHGFRVDVFESKFPIFPDIKYSSCLRTNLDVLTKNLHKLNQLGIRSASLSKELSDRHLRATVRKVRFKNGYDRNFFFAYKDGYQEVFKLKEERPDRVIIAMDFNSMYLDSMKGKFCNPVSVKYKDFQGMPPELDDLGDGIFRVRLCAAKQSFLLDHHPFRYKRLGRSYYFRMDVGDTVETLLYKDEVIYFAPYFERVEIIEGLFSTDTIEHPLFPLCQDRCRVT